jgi:hypothetical protein
MSQTQCFSQEDLVKLRPLVSLLSTDRDTAAGISSRDHQAFPARFAPCLQRQLHKSEEYRVHPLCTSLAGTLRQLVKWDALMQDNIVLLPPEPHMRQFVDFYPTTGEYAVRSNLSPTDQQRIRGTVAHLHSNACTESEALISYFSRVSSSS